MAVTVLAGISMLTFLIACFSPYQMERFLTSNAGTPAASAAAGSLGAELSGLLLFELGVGDDIVRLDISLGDPGGAVASEKADEDIDEENSDDEDERAGPGLAMPIFVR